MKKYFCFILIFLGSWYVSISQNDKVIDAKVEKSVFGLQTGFLGVWGHHEYGLTNTIVLRTELGLDSGVFGGAYYDNNVNFMLFPTITLEPRLYYSLKNRVAKGKSIAKNSSNFIALKANYIPDWFVVSNSSRNVRVAENYSILVKWGLKRTIGRHFTYETGIGLGYRTYFLKQYGHSVNDNEVALDLHIRIGYTF